MFCSVTSRSDDRGGVRLGQHLPKDLGAATAGAGLRGPGLVEQEAVEGVLSTVNEPRPHAVLPSALRSTKRNSIWSSVPRADDVAASDGAAAVDRPTPRPARRTSGRSRRRPSGTGGSRGWVWSRAHLVEGVDRVVDVELAERRETRLLGSSGGPTTPAVRACRGPRSRARTAPRTCRDMTDMPYIIGAIGYFADVLGEGLAGLDVDQQPGAVGCDGGADGVHRVLRDGSCRGCNRTS